MKQILKWELDPRFEDNSLTLPYSSKILSVQLQDGRPVLYTTSDVGDPNGDLCFNILRIATGGSRDLGSSLYIGTTMMPNGLVWHWFH